MGWSTSCSADPPPLSYSFVPPSRPFGISVVLPSPAEEKKENTAEVKKLEHLNPTYHVPIEEIQCEASKLMKPELFEGMRFDFSEELNQKFSLSHNVFKGSMMELPSQPSETVDVPSSNYDFRANFLDAKVTYVRRISTGDRLNARVNCDNTTIHSSRRHVYHKSFSSIATSGDDDRAIDRSSPCASSSSPTISYLVRICGLSTQSAISVSKKIELKSPKKCDSVLGLLREYGFTDEHITCLIIRYPRILSVKSDLNLKPKLEFLVSEGFSHQQVVDVLLNNPVVLLNSSLERKIVPFFTSIKTILPNNADITQFLKHANNLSTAVWLANIETLRSNGVPESIVRKMFTLFTSCISRNPSRFAKAVEKTMDMGFKPSKVSSFVHAVGVLSYMKESTWERKVMLYKSLGWSREDTLLVFKRNPLCLGISDKHIKNKMNFFTQKMGYSPKHLISVPLLLRFSLEKRIIPRCSVMSLLMAKGLINTISLYNLKIPTVKFLGKFVDKYKDQVPEVVEAYNGKLDFKG